MNADCAFVIGKTHAICQDYAAAASGEAASVTLADGCSSSADTDIGARLLAKSAERLLQALSLNADRREEWADFPGKAARAAWLCARRLGLPSSSLDATLMTVKADAGAFLVTVCGDGVVALGRHDGTIDVLTIGFAANYPQYASYALDASRRRQWAAQPGNIKTVQRGTLTGAECTLVETVESTDAVEFFAGTAAEYRFAAVLSDGVQSFARTEQTETSRATYPVLAADVLAALLAFKGGQGHFVQRRMQAFGKECARRGWHHSDDLSLAAVWLGE